MWEWVPPIALLFTVLSFGLLVWNKTMEARTSWRGVCLWATPWGDGTKDGERVYFVELKNLTLFPFHIKTYGMVDCALRTFEDYPPPSVLSAGESIHLSVSVTSDRAWFMFDGYSMRDPRIGEAGWTPVILGAFDSEIDALLDQDSERLFERMGRRIGQTGRTQRPRTVGPTSHLGTRYERFKTRDGDGPVLYREVNDNNGTWMLR